MKRFVGTLKRTSTQLRSNGASYPQDSLEDKILKEITTFCNSGTSQNGTQNQGDEFLHLPAIVEAAESSPAAAKAAAHQLHKYLSKPNSPKEQQQYNAIMLVRILCDNPGPTFTRNIDARFVASLKILLRDGQDVSVQQILRETLEFLATTKAGDANLTELINMWKKEKDKFVKQFGIHPLQRPVQGMYPGYRQDFFTSDHRIKSLPTPEELAGRVSEASTSAKLLLQMVQSTSPSEFFQNDMLKEFANRCQRASRSMQLYMEATNPAPDEETMMTLIETNDKISVALSKYQRAHLNARKHVKATQSQTQVDQLVDTQPPNDAPVSPIIAAPVPRSKPHLPLLSIPRKAFKKFQQQPPRETTAQTTVPAPAPAPTHTSGVSPIESMPPPSFPPRAQNTESSSTSQGYQYQINPGHFQTEDPFADKFSTAVDDDKHQDLYYNNTTTIGVTTSNHDYLSRNGDSNTYHSTWDNDNSGTQQPFGVATTGTTTMVGGTGTVPAPASAPLTSGTYYPSAHDNLFDDDLNLPPVHNQSTVGNVART